jgi:hypothetical protein
MSPTAGSTDAGLFLSSSVPSIAGGRKYTSAIKELIDTERGIDQARFQEVRYNLKRKAALRMYSMFRGYEPAPTEKAEYDRDLKFARSVYDEILQSAPPVVEEPEIAVRDQFDRVVYNVIAEHGQKIEVESEHLVAFLKGFNERAREGAFYNASNAIDGPWTDMHVLLEKWGIWRYDMEISEEKSADDDSSSLARSARRRSIVRGRIAIDARSVPPELPGPVRSERDDEDEDDEDDGPPEAGGLVD